MYSIEKNLLLDDGFSEKFADYYLNLVKKEKANTLYNQDYVEWAHKNGFLAESAYAYGLNDTNISDFLCDYDYYRVWPLNTWTRIWINDKLTLKYMLADTEFSEIMPKYYYYISSGILKKLIDAPNQNEEPTYEEFVSVLKNVGEFACKPCNGTTSLGFFKLSYKSGKIFAGNKEICENCISEFLNGCNNYIFTEYLYPSKKFAEYNDNIHTLRLVVINENGNTPKIIGGYLRLPNKFSGEANYLILDESNANKYNVFVKVDIESGDLGPGKLTYFDKAVDSDIYPDNGKTLFSKIDNYAELKKIILGISKRFSTVEYMGFDIGITDKGFKCMEINSHPGIKYMQIFKPFFEDDYLKNYFNEKIQYISDLSLKEKKIETI